MNLDFSPYIFHKSPKYQISWKSFQQEPRYSAKISTTKFHENLSSENSVVAFDRETDKA
jgi:hypothetical protein